MKYLETPELGLLASTLSNSSQPVRSTTRIEAYSCKSVARERKMIKSLDQEFTSDLEISNSASSPELLPSALESAFGRLDRKDCRKTFWLLIATLNAAYPDHNFSHVKVANFNKEKSARAVLLKLSNALEFDGSGSNFASSLGALSISSGAEEPSDGPQIASSDPLAGVHPLIRQVLDPVIDLAQCEVYSYSPDLDSDPHAVDSDDEDEFESVASSIYGSNRADPLTHSHRDIDEGTMWEMEEVDAPYYINPNNGSAILSFHQQHMSIQTVSIPNTPRTHEPPCPGFSGRFNQHHTHDLRCPNSRSSSIHLGSTLEEDSAGGLLWSSHHFFYNRKMKRILFISTWGRKVLAASSFHDSAVTHQGQDQLESFLTSHNVNSAIRNSLNRGSSSNAQPSENRDTSVGQSGSDSIHDPRDHKRRLSLPLTKVADPTMTSGHVGPIATRTRGPKSPLSGLVPTRPKKKMRTRN